MNPMEDALYVEKRLINKAKLNKSPINGSIELLPLCNMNCDMCYVRLSKKEMDQKGKMRTAKEWLEVAKEMQKAGTLFLLLTGGEPFLYPEFKEVYLGLKDLGFVLTINTNGTLIDEDMAQFLGKYRPRRVNITLYGADERAYTELCHYPGGFEKTMNAIKLLRKYNVDVKVASSLTKANAPDMDRIIALQDKLNVPVRVDTYMMPATRERDKPYQYQSRCDPITAAQIRFRMLKTEMGEENYKEYIRLKHEQIENFEPEEEPRKVTCMAGNCSFTINWQGEMRPCVILSQPSISVFEEGFDKAWKQIVDELDKIRLNIKCSQCHLRPLCQTCSACALLEAGSYDAIPQYMCDYAEESYRILEEEYKRLNEYSKYNE